MIHCSQRYCLICFLLMDTKSPSHLAWSKWLHFLPSLQYLQLLSFPPVPPPTIHTLHVPFTQSTNRQNKGFAFPPDIQCSVREINRQLYWRCLMNARLYASDIQLGHPHCKALYWARDKFSSVGKWLLLSQNTDYLLCSRRPQLIPFKILLVQLNTTALSL